MMKGMGSRSDFLSCGFEFIDVSLIVHGYIVHVIPSLIISPLLQNNDIMWLLNKNTGKKGSSEAGIKTGL